MEPSCGVQPAVTTGLHDPLMSEPSTRSANRVAHTRLVGDLDVVSVGRAVETLLSAARTCDVLEVDLSDVTFIDPCGARALVVGERAMHNAGGRIRFLEPRPPVAQVLQLIGVV